MTTWQAPENDWLATREAWKAHGYELMGTVHVIAADRMFFVAVKSNAEREGSWCLVIYEAFEQPQPQGAVLGDGFVRHDLITAPSNIAAATASDAYKWAVDFIRGYSSAKEEQNNEPAHESE